MGSECNLNRGNDFGYVGRCDWVHTGVRSTLIAASEVLGDCHGQAQTPASTVDSSPFLAARVVFEHWVESLLGKI